MLAIKGLSKRYGAFDAVKNLSLNVEKGQLYGFLGPNGAGKTTTMRMVMGILVPTAGSIAIDGRDSREHREEGKRAIGFVPDNPIFYDYMRGREILTFVAEMHGQSAAEASDNAARLLDSFALGDAAEEFAVNFSLGMKKKLGLAAALIHEPKLLILDEPTSGLDPRASKDVQHRLERFAADGGTVFLSSHLLPMVERICQRIAVIHNGELVADGSLAAIKEQLKSTGDLEELFLTLTESDGEEDGGSSHA